MLFNIILLHINMANYSPNAYSLEKGFTYKFSAHYDFISDVDDRMPHYYLATYIGRKKQDNAIWVFKNFMDQETKKFFKTKEIKHFGLMYPNFELVDNLKDM